MIVKKKVGKERNFKQVSVGEVFLFGECIYMKIDYYKKSEVNAVELEFGVLAVFNEDDKVNIVTAELTIE